MNNSRSNIDAESKEIYIELQEKKSINENPRLSNNYSEKGSLTLQHESVENNSLKRNISIALLLIILLSPGILYMVNSDFRAFIKEKAEALSELKPSFSTVLIFWSIGFVISLAAQHSVSFEIIIAYVFKGFWESFFLIMIYKVAAIFCIYHVTKWFLFEKIEQILEKYDLFHLLRYLAVRRPWKTIFIIRFALLPKFVKNYGIPILGYNLYQVMSVTFLSDAYFTLIPIIIGLTARSFVAIEDGTYSDDNSLARYLPIIAGVIGAILVGYLFVYSKRVIREVQERYSIDLIKMKFLNRAPSTGSLRDIMD